MNSARPKKKFPCGHCKEECTGGTSVPCGFCEIWFHTKCCDGMTDAFKESCDAMNRIYGSSAFLCVVCRKLASKMSGSFKELFKRVEALETMSKAAEVQRNLLKENREDGLQNGPGKGASRGYRERN